MARIPIIQTQSLVQRGSTNIETAPSQVGRIGSALASIASTIHAKREHERVIAERNEKQARAKREHDEANLHAANTHSRLQIRVIERQAEAEAVPDGLVGYTDRALKAFDTDAEEEIKGAPEYAKPLLQQNAARMRAELHVKTFGAELAARRSKLATDFESGLDVDRRLVQTDPSQFNDALARRRGVLAELDIPQQAKQKLDEHATESLAFDAAASLAESDPVGFLRIAKSVDGVKSHPVLSHLKPENLRQAVSHASARAAQLAGAAERDADKALKAAEKEFDTLRDFAISGQMPDLGYQAQVLATTKGTIYEAPAKAMLEQAAKGAAFGALTLPRQRETLRIIEAQLAQGTSPEAAKVLQTARSVNERQEREFKENPWSASARFQRLPAVPDTPLPTADMVPQYVAQALEYMPALEAVTGRPVSPLQPQQAAKFAQDLLKLPPDAQASVLGQTGGLLSIGQIDALAEQVDKSNKPLALALKLGADKSPAGWALATTMLRGARALADKTVKRDDQVMTGWRAEIAGMIRGTLGDAKAEQDAIDAAYYTRAGMDEPGYPYAAGNEQAVKLVLGQPLERGGVKMVLPRGMSENDFTEKVRGHTPERLKEMVGGDEVYVRGQPVKLEHFAARLPSMGMQRAPGGLWIPVSGNAFVTIDKEGTLPLRLQVQ